MNLPEDEIQLPTSTDKDKVPAKEKEKTKIDPTLWHDLDLNDREEAPEHAAKQLPPKPPALKAPKKIPKKGKTVEPSAEPGTSKSEKEPQKAPEKKKIVETPVELKVEKVPKREEEPQNLIGLSFYQEAPGGKKAVLKTPEASNKNKMVAAQKVATRKVATRKMPSRSPSPAKQTKEPPKKDPAKLRNPSFGRNDLEMELVENNKSSAIENKDD